MTLYDTLGVDQSASVDEVRRAYRKRAQKAHPDKKGGNTEQFHQIQRAYDVLSDAGRRAHYDATGEDAPVEDLRTQALTQIGELFLRLVEAGDEQHTNFIDAMRRFVKEHKSRDELQFADLRRAIHKREAAIKRVRHKGSGQNRLVAVLLVDIRAKKRTIAFGEMKMALHDEMLKVLDEYDYEADPAAPVEIRFASMCRGGPFA